PAHLAQPDETDLRHFGSLIIAVRARTALTGSSPCSRTRSAGRLSSRSVFRSPIAWAFLSVVKVQEATGLRPALVELACRVQEARAVAERGGCLRGFADRHAQLGHGLVELG